VRMNSVSNKTPLKIDNRSSILSAGSFYKIISPRKKPAEMFFRNNAVYLESFSFHEVLDKDAMLTV